MMSLRNLMEDKQLNFNQPLLSVRRFSSSGTSSEASEKTIIEPNIPHLPVYKSELKSGPVRNPGTVPFVWEQTPGKPKDEESKTKTQVYVRPPLVPKLPPGRSPNVKHEVLSSANAPSDEIAKETKEEKTSSGSENEEEEEVYRDAVDRFSRSESFFLNCSISGVSGFDGSEIESSGAFSTDPQARDFMMDRFLPAAKAMASETPPHPIRKQAVVIGRPREIKMVTNGNRQNRSVQTQYVQEPCEEESEDEDDDYDGSRYSSAQGCGFFPRFCLKGSLVLLNSVPGMKIQATPVSSVRRIRNSSTGNSSQIGRKSNIQEQDTICMRLQIKGSNYQNEFSQSVHKKVNDSLGCSENDTNSGANESEPHRRSRNSFQELLVDEPGSGSPVIEKTLYIDSVHKRISPDSGSSSLDMKGLRNLSGDTPDDASLKSTETKDLYILHSTTQNIKKSKVEDEKTILRPNSLESVDSCSLNSSSRSFCEWKMDLNCSRINQEQNPDTIKSTNSQFSYGKKFDLESQFPLKPSNRGGSHGHTKNSLGSASSNETDSEEIDLNRTQPEKSSQEGKNLAILEEHSRKLETDGRRIEETGSPESFRGFAQNSLDLRTTKLAANGKIDLENQILKRESNRDSSDGRYSRMPFAPPPTKSPSESWLQRTLPTSSRNSSSTRSSLAKRINAISSTTSPNPRWEYSVKSSKMNHQHLQFSEELLSSIPEV